MAEKNLRKLTEEEKQKVIFVVNDIFSEDLPEEPTEYDVLMKQKLEEFTQDLLKDNGPEEVDALLEMCEEYIRDIRENGKKQFPSYLAFAVMYDMWLNKSPVWPVGYNPEWKEWDKLKEKKLNV